MQEKVLPQDCPVLVVGTGKLGLRHVEGLARASRCGPIWGLDYSKEANKAFEALGKSLRPDNKAQFEFASEVHFLPRAVGLLIVATTADSRGSALASVLEFTQPQFVLLEKPISSSRAGLETLQEVCPDGAYVNFPRRYSPLHVEAIRRAADFRRNQVRIIVTLPRPTLLSNAAHHMDFASEVLGERPRAVMFEPTKLTPVESKRKGFLDLSGQFSVAFPSGAEFIIYTEPASKRLVPTGVKCLIESGSAWLRIDEGKSTLSSSTGEQLTLAAPPLQSKLTGDYLEELQVRGFLNLPTLIEAAPAHELLLTAVEEIEQKLGLELPFT